MIGISAFTFCDSLKTVVIEDGVETINKRKRDVEKAIGERFALKDARRAYGQRMLDRGVPIESVSYAMGHDSIKTTQKYYANYRKDSVLDNIYDVMRGRPEGMP